MNDIVRKEGGEEDSIERSWFQYIQSEGHGGRERSMSFSACVRAKDKARVGGEGRREGELCTGISRSLI
jgi:hypothetical protein